MSSDDDGKTEQEQRTVLLLDRTNFHLSDEAFAAFQAAVNRLPVENCRLRKLLDAVPPWSR